MNAKIIRCNYRVELLEPSTPIVLEAEKKITSNKFASNEKIDMEVWQKIKMPSLLLIKLIKGDMA